ncbi:MAG TPA: hypothetical protein VI636_12550 [Candidatus Angelobacter sp.]
MGDLSWQEYDDELEQLNGFCVRDPFGFPVATRNSEPNSFCYNTFRCNLVPARGLRERGKRLAVADYPVIRRG